MHSYAAFYSFLFVSLLLPNIAATVIASIAAAAHAMNLSPNYIFVFLLFRCPRFLMCAASI
jgi:hypothetical protein